jgi:hypothetical protein
MKLPPSNSAANLSHPAKSGYPLIRTPSYELTDPIPFLMTVINVRNVCGKVYRHREIIADDHPWRRARSGRDQIGAIASLLHKLYINL